jgi:uncharacterized protein YbaP (TraB family)
MMRLKTAMLAAALGLFAAAPGLAQTAATPAPLPDADPALFVVRDADTTIYLFGTFHMLDGRPWFNDEVRTAFDASDELVLEAVMPEDQSAIAQLTLRYAVDGQGRILSSRLTPAENEQLSAALTENGLPPAIFDRFEPWYVSLAVTVAAVQRAGLAGQNGAEMTLSAAARARNMPVGELEGFEFQMRLLDGIPEELQLVQLRGTLRELGRLQQVLVPALAAWSSGDLDALDRALDDPASNDPRLRRIFLGQRNEAWARWISERLARPGTVFIAVGAGHLAGRDSVQAALAEAGLRAERVPHVE